MTFFPKWKGFLVDEPGEEKMTATTALSELFRVIDCMTKVWVKEIDAARQRKEPADFRVETVSACGCPSLSKLLYLLVKPNLHLEQYVH